LGQLDALTLRFATFHHIAITAAEQGCGLNGKEKGAIFVMVKANPQ
jgi:hypothetical protein